MLVITRKNGERLIIGHDIEVTVLKIRGNCVKLGIRGPADLPIYREELLASILQPSPDTNGARTCSAGLTAEEQGEKRRSLSLGGGSGQLSGIAPKSRTRLVPDGQTADSELERRIRSFLKGLNLPALGDLEVGVRHGAAVITGHVCTFYQKQLATSRCQRVAGVLSVRNEVSVADSPGMPAT